MHERATAYAKEVIPGFRPKCSCHLLEMMVLYGLSHPNDITSHLIANSESEWLSFSKHLASGRVSIGNGSK